MQPSKDIIVPPINPICRLPSGEITHCVPATAQSIPTLGEYGAGLLIVLILVVAWKKFHHRFKA